MIINNAVAKADDLRPNTFSDEQKFNWLMVLEAEVAEMMGQKLPTADFPNMTKELLMPYPYDNIYPLYLATIIDYYNTETTLYQNDSVIFEEAKRDAFAWYRRQNKPQTSDNWSVM